MKKNSDDYHISFFRPTTDRARFNRNLVVWLASIWFIAIFGFQITLRIIQKPTPEPALKLFNSAWEAVSAGTATTDHILDFGSATLTVLSKVSIAPTERTKLDNAISWAVFTLTPDSLRSALLTDITAFEARQKKIETLSDEIYLQEKAALSAIASPILHLSPMDIRTKILPLELVSEHIEQLQSETVAALPGIMTKYLVHNQSVLTDITFLGFPFHYFYTAFFLLVLFVGLCLVYCLRTDRRNVILKIDE